MIYSWIPFKRYIIRSGMAHRSAAVLIKTTSMRVTPYRFFFQNISVVFFRHSARRVLTFISRIYEGRRGGLCLIFHIQIRMSDWSRAISVGAFKNYDSPSQRIFGGACDFLVFKFTAVTLFRLSSSTVIIIS